MLKLLIADATEEFTLALTEQVAGKYEIEVCHEGKQTLELLRSFKPDLLVLDMMMPGLDGISLLQQADQEGRKPMVLAVSRFINDYVLASVTELGVGYVMRKPCDIKATAARLSDLVQHMEKPAVTRPDPRVTISNVLLSLGMRTKLDGYAYSREAILVAMERSGQMVTKEIYPAVAKICGVSTEQVERSIRSAVLSAIKRGDPDVWKLYFVPGPDGQVERPTNAEFISGIADKLCRQQET